MAPTINRPGTIVTTAGSFALPAQPPSHAIAYMFVTVPFGQSVLQNGQWVEAYETQGYSELIPNVPTQVTSVDDYLSKIGGSVPDPNQFYGAWVSYQSVKLFFRNAGNQGVLYVIRVPFTPEVKINFADPLTALQGGNQVRLVSVKIGGRYVGQDLTDIAVNIGVNDSDGLPIWALKTSAADSSDVAYDVAQAINADPAVKVSYSVNQTQVTSGVLSVYAKGVGVYPIIPASNLNYYGSNATITASAGTATLYTSQRRISFRLSTTNVVTYASISGTINAQSLEAAYRAATGLVSGNIPSNAILAIEGDRYYSWDGVEFTPTINNSSQPVVINSSTFPAYSPKAVQVFYVNIAGENRAIIVDGTDNNNPGQAPRVNLFSQRLVTEINAILKQKGIDEYYEVTASSWNLDIPNAVVIDDYNRSSADISPVLATDPRKKPGTVASTGFKSYEYVAHIDVLSKIGSPAPIIAGISRSGNQDANVVTSPAPGQPADFLTAKNEMDSKVQDYIFSFESSIDPDRYDPGFLLCPEAFAITTSDLKSLAYTGLTKSEARNMRFNIASALQGVAKGIVVTSDFSGGAGIQSLGAGTALEMVALIDCGPDITSHLDAQLELQFFKDRLGDSQGHAAYYAPYLVTIDDGNPMIPPSAGVAGIALARYSQEGFQQPPAGTKYALSGVQDVSFRITSQQQEVSNPLGLNAIRILPNKGVCVWGSRTMSSNPLYKFVNTRVILNVLIRTLAKSFDDILFDVVDGTGALFNRVRNIGIQICNQLYQNNALYGAKAEDAYTVVCDTTNNPPLDLENGTVKLDVYVVPSPTLERIFVSVIRTPIGQIALIKG